MSHDENPLDRISSGPAPTGPNPWRANRLPTGSPYANGLSGTGRTKNPHRLGRAGWITLIVAVALIAGAVGWAAVSKPSIPDFSSPIGDGPAAPPAAPSIGQVTASPLFVTPLSSPTCSLPPLSTDRAAVETFARTGTACLAAAWSMRPGEVVVFSDPNNIAPGPGCFAGRPVTSIGTCGDRLDLNYDAAVRGTGSQAGPLLVWLAISVAERAATHAGQSADVSALIRAAGESTPAALDHQRRRHIQTLCLAGATIRRLVDHGIARADMVQASAQARVWSRPGGTPDGTKVEPDTAQAWFDRGGDSPTQEVCRNAWTVPVEQIP